MKHVVGISLGSSKRNHTVQVNLAGIECKVERIGTDGDLQKMIDFIKENDGKVDAFGLGGMDLYIYALDRRYEIRDARKVVGAAQQTPIVDGSGLKHTLERRVIQFLSRNTDIFQKRPEVLMMSAMDRLGMAKALEEQNCRITYGDLLYVLGLPFPLYSLKTIARLARIIAPVVSLLPFKLIYPTGDKQEINKPRFARYFKKSAIIAGDFHFIKRYMPADLSGKIIITNTITADDILILKDRNVKMLITTTPELEGRSFGTNVLEALLVCLEGAKTELSWEQYHSMLEELNIEPRIMNLTPGENSV